jgi:hypothetical protein
MGHPFVQELKLLVDSDYTLAGSALWPDYHRVCFSSKEELKTRIALYLHDDQLRATVSRNMLTPVLQHLTYRRINHRLLQFIATDLLAPARRAGCPQHTPQSRAVA